MGGTQSNNTWGLWTDLMIHNDWKGKLKYMKKNFDDFLQLYEMQRHGWRPPIATTWYTLGKPRFINDVFDYSWNRFSCWYKKMLSGDGSDRDCRQSAEMEHKWWVFRQELAMAHGENKTIEEWFSSRKALLFDYYKTAYPSFTYQPVPPPPPKSPDPTGTADWRNIAHILDGKKRKRSLPEFEDAGLLPSEEIISSSAETWPSTILQTRRDSGSTLIPLATQTAPPSSTSAFVLFTGLPTAPFSVPAGIKSGSFNAPADALARIMAPAYKRHPSMSWLDAYWVIYYPLLMAAQRQNLASSQAASPVLLNDLTLTMAGMLIFVFLIMVVLM